MKLFTRYALFFIALVLLYTQSAYAQRSISPDSTWGINGVLNFAGNTPLCMDIQPDGKFVIGDQGYDVGVLRFNADGARDSSFGTAGYTKLITGGYNIYVVKVLPNGKILTCALDGNRRNFVFRLTAGGQIDSTFGTNGSTRMDSLDNVLPNLLVLSDGSIRFVYTDTDPIFGLFSFPPAIMKLDISGHLDNTFGNVIIYPMKSQNLLISVLDHSDRVILGGKDTSGAWVLAAILPDGSMDNTFGTNGYAVINEMDSNPLTQSGSVVIDLLIQSDNSIKVILGTESAVSTFFLAHFFSNGVQDNSYGQGGLSPTIYYGELGADFAGAVPFDNGDIMIATQLSYNGGTYTYVENYLQMVTSSGQQEFIFPGQGDSILLALDSSINNGNQETFIVSLNQIPGQDQVMATGYTITTGHPFFAKYKYSGFVDGINSIRQASAFTIYPNPSSGLCTIRLAGDAEQKYNAQLNDMTGQVVGMWGLDGGQNTFATSPYPAGIYTLKVSNSQGAQSVKKLVIE